jgi:hypothetical protein
MKSPSTDLKVELEIIGTPWTPGPWTTGPAPHGHCRIYSEAETHAIARTYGPELNGIGICSLTGPQNAADAALIALAPEMVVILLTLKAAFILGEKPENYEPMMTLTSRAMGDAVVLIDRLIAATAPFETNAH